MDKMVELLTSIAEPALNLFKPCGRRGPAVVAATQPVDSKSLQQRQQLESPPESPRSGLGQDDLVVDQISSGDGSAVVAVKRDIVVINITSHSAAVCHKFLGSIFTILEEDGIPIDFVATSAVDCSLAINSATANAARIDAVRGHLFREGRVSVFPKMANLVLTVGEDSETSITVLAGRMLSLLSGKGIKIEMISKGTCVPSSPFCVSCVASGSMITLVNFPATKNRTMLTWMQVPAKPNFTALSRKRMCRAPRRYLTPACSTSASTSCRTHKQSK